MASPERKSGKGTVSFHSPTQKEVYHGDVEISGDRVLLVNENGTAMNLPFAWCVILWG